MTDEQRSDQSQEYTAGRATVPGAEATPGVTNSADFDNEQPTEVRQYPVAEEADASRDPEAGRE